METSRGITYETIVVTSDRTYYGRPTVRTIYEEGGPAHKRNVGTRMARADVLVYLDDDTEVSPYCLYELWRGLQELPQAGMLFAKILKMDRRDIFDDCGSWLTWTGFLWARAGNSQRDTGQYDDPRPILASKSATCAIRREAFQRVGGFDGSYFILGEETDLAWRVWLSGSEVWYWPTARSWHAFGTSLKPISNYYTLERIHFHGCKNYIQLLVTNLGCWQLACILPVHLLGWCVAAASFGVRGQWKRSGWILKGIWWNVKSIQRTLRKRRQVQRSRQFPERQLMTIIKYTPPWTYYSDRLWRYLIQGLHG